MQTYLRFLRFVRPYWAYLSGSIVCIIFFTIFSSASLVSVLPFVDVIFYGGEKTQAVSQTRIDETETPLATSSFARLKDLARQKVYDFLLAGGRQTALLKLSLLILLLIAFKNLFDYAQAYLMAHVEQGVIMDLRNELYRHLNELSLSYFNQTRTGQMISRITNDVNLVNGGVSAGFVTLVKYPLLVIAYLTIAFVISWQLTLTALIILPLSLGIIGAIGSRLRRASSRSQEKMADVTSVLQETLSGARVVKAFAMEEYEVQKFRNETWAYFKTLLRVTRVSKLAGPLTETLGALVGVGLLWFGGQQVLAGNSLGPGEFLLFLLAIFSVMQPVKELSSVNNRLQEAIAAGQRIFDLIDTEPEIRSSENAKLVSRFDRRIEYDLVSFAYENNLEVLSGVSFEVRKGEILAIVGPSGAGKTTLVDLLPRFYEPTAGRILLDDTDIREIELRSLRKLMGIVTQETILFQGTVRSNIAYGLQDIPEERIVEAARAANAHRFISEFTNGYDSMIGERGVKLSGGQRQRIAIARAILKNPPILILDEATSSLDSESELLVQQAIERLMVNRTTFVIAHRLSTILNADHIIVLDRGRIVQSGKHDNLIEQRGIYQRLYRMQFRA